MNFTALYFTGFLKNLTRKYLLLPGHRRADILKYPTLSSLAFGIFRQKFLGKAEIPIIEGEMFNFFLFVLFFKKVTLVELLMFINLTVKLFIDMMLINSGYGTGSGSTH